MRTARRKIGVAVAVATVAIGAAAFTAPAAPAQVGQPTTCQALTALAAQLDSAMARTAAAAAAVEQRLAAGGLTPRQAAVARAQLALLRFQLALLGVAQDRVEALLARVCGGSPPPPPPPPPPPSPPPGGEE